MCLGRTSSILTPSGTTQSTDRASEKAKWATTNKFRQEVVTWTKQLGLFDDPKVVQALAEISKREDSDPPSPNAPLSAALDEWIKWNLDYLSHEFGVGVDFQ